ncbi:MAG: fluoride efflux transporter CrcB [Alphaproteobacteria bacterium]|jgi:CrcB protein|nr:fluoride efflux transporter CrcB [Alphaproteobacteria bacterium]
MHTLVVMLGGAIGAGARFWLDRWISHWADTAFPWGTLACNGLGSFAIGIAFAVLGSGPDAALWRLFLMTGLLGGFTTFSAFSMQTLILVRSGQTGAALLNAGASLLICLAACAVGGWLAAGLRA